MLKVESVPEITTREARGTPAMPFEVTMSRSCMVNSWPSVRGMG